MKKNKNYKDMKGSWYIESQKRREREKYFFYSLVFIAVVMLLFASYLLIEI